MFARFRSRMTYANVASSLALFIAVSTGGAYAANTVGSDDVIDESLQTQDIQNGQVKNLDLGVDSVTFGKIQNGTITNADYANNSITSTKLLDGTIAEADLADGAVTSPKIADGGVANADLAANSVTFGKILNGTVTAADLAPDSVAAEELADGAVTSAKVLDDTVAGGGLGPTDLAANSVTQSEIANDAVNATEVADDSIDSGEIVDFGLSNQDVGVLFAQVNANGTLANSSGGVTPTKLNGLGTYEVDFGRDVSFCAFVVTQGDAGVGSAAGAITGVTDRSGNVEAAFVSIRSNANASVDRGFQIVAVC